MTKRELLVKLANTINKYEKRNQLVGATLTFTEDKDVFNYDGEKFEKSQSSS